MKTLYVQFLSVLYSRLSAEKAKPASRWSPALAECRASDASSRRCWKSSNLDHRRSSPALSPHRSCRTATVGLKRTRRSRTLIIKLRRPVVARRALPLEWWAYLRTALLEAEDIRFGWVALNLRFVEIKWKVADVTVVARPVVGELVTRAVRALHRLVLRLRTALHCYCQSCSLTSSYLCCRHL